LYTTVCHDPPQVHCSTTQGKVSAPALWLMSCPSRAAVQNLCATAHLWGSKIAYIDSSATRLFCKAALAHTVCLLSPAVLLCIACASADWPKGPTISSAEPGSQSLVCEHMRNQECRKTYAGQPCLGQTAWPEVHGCSARLDTCIQSDEGVLPLRRRYSCALQPCLAQIARA